MSNAARRLESEAKLRAARALVAPVLDGRRKCPGERMAYQNGCQVDGCDHLTNKLSRICMCCLSRAGVYTRSRIQLLRRYGELEQVIAAEDEAIGRVNAFGRKP